LLRRSLTCVRLVHQQTIARQHSSPIIAAGTAIARMVMAPPPALFSAPGGRCGGGEGKGEEGGGGGATFAMMGGVTTASTAIEMPVTLASIEVALLGLLVALAIADCTEVASAVGVWMRTSTMTLPGDIVNSTADGSTPARAATALCIWVCTLAVNEETSPSRRRVNPTTLIAAGDGGEAAMGVGDGSGEGEADGAGEGEAQQQAQQRKDRAVENAGRLSAPRLLEPDAKPEADFQKKQHTGKKKQAKHYAAQDRHLHDIPRAMTHM
jgi:hypothetical protein